MRTRSPVKPAKAINRHLWLLEPLEEEETLVVRSMFSGRAVYLDGRMVLYLADRAEPWCGVAVPMEKAAHTSLIADCPSLAPHSQLPKWLYLSESADSFERDAQWLVSRIRARDQRIGAIPPLKKRRPKRAAKEQNAPS